MKKILSRLLAAALALSLWTVPAAALELEDAKTLLARHYYDGVPQEILELGSLEEILEALDDPYTTYLDADTYQALLQSINGQVFVGIGATVETAYDSGYRIMSVLPDSPALEAGVQAGDILIAVDGTPLSASVDPRTLILGEAGTDVTLTVTRGGVQMDFTLTRREVTIPLVTYELVDGAAYLDCTSFGSTTASTIQKALRELDGQTAVWIVDLRANPGGTDVASALAAGQFIGPGIMLYFRDGSGTYYYRAISSLVKDLTDKPVILLLGPHSASGSELFAGDIRDYQAGAAVGQRSFGKGIAQMIFDETNCPYMTDGEALRITVYRFFSPNGTTNHIVGVLPTLVVSPENTQAVALMLSQPKPSRAAGHLKLELAGQTFYLDPTDAKRDAAAFAELLEALPPAAKLYKGSGTQIWTELSPVQAADDLGLQLNVRSFTDISGSAFQREIATLAAYQLLDGNGDGTFDPSRAVTRAEFCAMTAAALGLPAGEGTFFSDVDSGAWYAGAVSGMADIGFISGKGAGTFCPADTITYQEMAAVLASVAAWASMDGYKLSQTPVSVEQWPDYYEYAEWAQRPARDLAELGVLIEDIAPDAPVTRETAAALVCRLMESIGLIWD